MPSLTVKPNRPSWEEYHFGQAEKAASRSTCARAQIGAVAVTRTNKIIASAYNGVKAGETHCIDLTDPVVFANHDMLCEHAEINLVKQLREIFNSVVVALGYMHLAISDDEPRFRRWVESLGITVYIHGPREVCSHCARSMWIAGVSDVITRNNAHTRTGTANV